ncbi:CHASE3 domain-containing protein [Caulobacter soli]|uniref:CHASE3 domain-containing protein n=1 Tax=Caulobacter soli TaxID=2708539 RepID=UPI0013EC12DA|nr:CHASE3 domain-containing protein [Caulobacter soli]
MTRVQSTNAAAHGQGVRLSLIVGFLLLVCAAVAAIVVAVTSADAERWATHSLEVRRLQAVTFSALQDAETAQRGYLLTGDHAYLEPYEQANARLPGLKRQMHALVADNSAQRQRLVDLEQAIDIKMAELDRTVAQARAGQADAAIARLKTNAGKAMMDRVRVLSQRFEDAEANLLIQRQAAVASQRSLLIGVIVLALAAAALLAFAVARETRDHAHVLTGHNRALENEIAQRERAEAQLRQAQKMEALGQLTGGVAHDFNNMLAIIVGNLDMLIRRLSGQEKLLSLAENALSGANRAAALTKGLLAFSRQQPLDPKPTDVNKCVSDMSELLRRSLGEHIAVETVLAGGLWRAFVDSPQLESAILNLAVNARDAMAEARPGGAKNGGRLTIETSNAFLDRAYADTHAEVEPGQFVLVAITDTGGGMPPEVMERAFDPFFTTKRLGEGTGLGLSQVHGFLKQSRGHIKLYSELGVGTTVKLYLPRDTLGVTVEEPAAPRQIVASGDAFTVLIAEDDPGVRGFAVSAARELGYKVIEADGATVALERLGQHPEIDLLLTDVVMPGSNGRQLVDAALTLRPDLKVIYMTGYTRNAIVHNGTLDAGTRLLTKPFTLEQLDRELRDALAGQ